MSEWVSGDWQAWWKFGDALGNLAACMQQLGVNLQWGIIEVDGSWDGNARERRAPGNVLGILRRAQISGTAQVLAGSVEYRIDAGRLMLTCAGGNGLGLHAA